VKVLYIFLDSTKSTGVIKKVKSKIKLLNGNGIEAEGLFINKYITEYFISKDEGITYVPLTVPTLPFFYNRRFIRNYKSKFEFNNFYKNLYSTLDREVSKKEFDLILFRYPLSNKFLLRFVKKYGSKIIFEHNSKELVELSLNGISTHPYLEEKRYGERILSRIKAITGVGQEITDYEVHRSGHKKLPHAVISNSIEVAKFKERTSPEFDGLNYTFLFLTGSPSPWVGIDIVLKSLSEFKSDSKKIKLLVIGPKTEKLLALSAQLGLDANVAFLGEKNSDELNEYFDKCHVAFGTMAMQRVGLNEHSSLKILEYASRGTPFVIGYKDTNFINVQEFSPYYLKLDFNDRNIDMNEVINFADRILLDKEHPKVMHRLSLQYLDTSLKMDQLRNFILSFKNK
jgi:glycosyltransferase involved in cell wall biosynthesis